MSDAMPESVDLDLDAERPATFRLHGEVFHLKQLSYRAFAAADKAFMTTLAAIDAAEEAADAEEARLKAEAEERGEEPPEVDVSDREARWSGQLDAFADFVAANIVEGDMAKFGAMRARDEHGIQQRDMHTLRRWLWEAQLGRPLASPAASGNGLGSSEASSKAESGSPVVVRPN